MNIFDLGAAKALTRLEPLPNGLISHKKILIIHLYIINR